MATFQTKIIEGNFKIIDKRGNSVNYTLWPQQSWLCHAVDAREYNAGHIILKAASIGISSTFLAYGMAEIMTKYDQTLVLLAHNEQLSELLLRRAKSFVRNAVEKTHGAFPAITREPKDEIELSNGSLAYIGTAGSNTDIGRGNPINILICTEVAFYANAGALMRGVLPRAKDGLKIFESTANGASGWFFHQCKKAFREDGLYYGYFIPWYFHPFYTNGPTVKLGMKTTEEIEMQEDFNLTDGQLQWRRDTIMELDDDETKGKGMSGEEGFKQEYPITWEEAFLRSGSPIFGHRVYQKVEQTLMEPAFIGDMEIAAY